MAQEVHYYDDHVVFNEGPFVICNPLGGGWRIEVELKGHICPVLPDMTIYAVIKKLGLVGKTNDKEQAELVCDALNQMVRQRQIKLEGNCWVYGAKASAA